MKKIAKKKSVARNKITFLNVHRLGAQLLRERERERESEEREREKKRREGGRQIEGLVEKRGRERESW